jgi:hypothetical protein
MAGMGLVPRLNGKGGHGAGSQVERKGRARGWFPGLVPGETENNG